jgi:hypothetical protein
MPVALRNSLRGTRNPVIAVLARRFAPRKKIRQYPSAVVHHDFTISHRFLLELLLEVAHSRIVLRRGPESDG